MRKFLFGSGLLLAALLLLLGWRGRSRESEAASAAAMDSVRHDAKSAKADLDPAVEREEAAWARDVAPLTLAPASSTIPEGSWEVVAVRGLERERVPEAQFWSLQLAPASRIRSSAALTALSDGSLDSLVAERGLRLERSPDGRTFAPDANPGRCVIARAPGLWGFALYTEQSENPLEVEMSVDRELSALVIDGTGAPVAGVRVAVQLSFRGRICANLAHADTNADGVARLPHVQVNLAPQWDHAYDCALSIDEPLAQRVGVPFKLGALPAERVTLVLPPTGQVLVEVTDAPADLEVALELAPPGTEARSRDRTPAAGNRRAVDGKVLFRFVALGQDVIPHTSSTSGRAHLAARASGPRSPGELVTLRLSRADSEFQLRGTLVERSGRLFAHEELFLWSSLRTRDGNDVHAREEFVTGPDGSFELTLHGFEDCERKLGLNLAPLTLRNAPELSANFVLPPGQRDLDAGRLEVPEEWLELLAERRNPGGMRALVAGRVVSADGEPEKGAYVEIFRLDPRTSTEDRWQSPDWIESADEGRFSRAGSYVGPLLLRAHGRSASSGFVRVTAGSVDVELVLSERASLRGRIHIEEPLSMAFLSVNATLRHRPPNAPEPLHAVARLDPEGNFIFEGLAAGLWDVRIGYGSLEQPLATIPGVRIEPGVANRDARLDPLDLAQHGGWREVQVLTPDGKPCQSLQICRAPEVPGDGPGYDFERTGRLLVRRAGPPVWISDGLHRSELIDPATCADVVRLRKRAAFQFTAAEGLLWPEGCEVELTLVATPPFACNFDDWKDSGELRAGQALELDCARHAPLSVVAAVVGKDSIGFPCAVEGLPMFPPDEGTTAVIVRWSKADVETAAKLANP